MDSSEYRRVGASPDVLSRGTIEATHRVLSAVDAALAAKVRNILATPRVPKPPRHAAGSHTDYFRVSLAFADVEAIVQALGDSEAEAVTAEDPRVSAIADLLDRWSRAADFLSA